MVSPSIHTCMRNAVTQVWGLLRLIPNICIHEGSATLAAHVYSIRWCWRMAKQSLVPRPCMCVSGQEIVWWMKLNYLGLLSSMRHLALLLRQWNSVPVLEYLLDFVTNAFLIYITIVATAHASLGDLTWFTRPCEKVGSGHKSRWGCWSAVTVLWYETVVSYHLHVWPRWRRGDEKGMGYYIPSHLALRIPVGVHCQWIADTCV